MRTAFLACVAFALLAAAGYAVSGAEQPKEPAKADSPDTECIDAARLATAALAADKIAKGDYKLVEVRNLVFRGPDVKGSNFWRVTFKLRSLLPENTDGIIGAGGEVFVEVDMKTHQAKVSGYGE